MAKTTKQTFTVVISDSFVNFFGIDGLCFVILIGGLFDLYVVNLIDGLFGLFVVLDVIGSNARLDGERDESVILLRVDLVLDVEDFGAGKIV